MAPICSPTPRPATGSAEERNLPVLTIVYNNALYGAVRRATLDSIRTTWRQRKTAGGLPISGADRRSSTIVEAHRGHGERVEHPAQLPAALQRAAAAVRAGRQALVNVICTI